MLKRIKLGLAVIAGTVAVSIPVVLTAGAAGQSDEFQLTLISQNSTSYTFGYPQQSGYGYLYYTKETSASDWLLVSNTNDATKTTVKFNKGSYDYKVAAKVEGPSGRYTPNIPPPDTTAPSVPTGLTSSNVTQTSFNTNWNASTDNVAVTGYEVTMNGTATNVTTTSKSYSGLTCATTYVVSVKALDAAGNKSAASNNLSVTTSACATGQTVNMGELNVLSGFDSGNANLLLAQQATLSQTATLQSLSFYVTTAAGNLRLGIYDSSGPSGGPGQKVAETNSFVPVVGWNTQNVTPIQLSAGTYWLAYLPSDNGLGFRDQSTGTTKLFDFSFGPMPQTFSTTPRTITAHWSFYATLNTSGGGGSDTVNPTASLTSPTDGSTVSGTINVSANASDNVGVSKVEFYRGSNLIGTDTSSPYSVNFDTTTVSNGNYVFSAKAYDAANNVGASDNISVAISNSVQPPPNGFPDASNTGTPVGVTLHTCTSPITNSGTYDLCQFNGPLEIYASNVNITRSLILGPVRPIEPETGLVISDTTINCQCLSTNDNDTPVAIMENNFTLIRVNIYNAGHGVSAKNNVTVQDSYIHGLGGNTQAHKNGIFVGDGHHQRFIHNNVECNDGSERGCTAAIGIYDDFSDVYDVVIDNNLLNTNGAYCFYGSGGPSKAYVSYNITFTNNHFGRKFEPNCAVLGPVTYWDSSQPGMVWSGNVWDDTGQIVNPQY